MFGKKKEQYNRFEMTHIENQAIGMTTSVLVDKETGVNYLFRQSGVYAGGLTVLVDRDGRPIVTDIK